MEVSAHERAILSCRYLTPDPEKERERERERRERERWSRMKTDHTEPHSEAMASSADISELLTTTVGN